MSLETGTRAQALLRGSLLDAVVGHSTFPKGSIYCSFKNSGSNIHTRLYCKTTEIWPREFKVDTYKVWGVPQTGFLNSMF